MATLPLAGQITYRTLLTLREVEVLRLVAQCFTDTEIAHILDIAEATAKSHTRHIKAKLGVSRRASLVLYAVKMGLVCLDDIVLR